MKIIIIDDDPIVCQSLKMIIEASSNKNTDKPIEVLALGYNGIEAIELYSIHKPDIILLDIRMEKMDGIEACKNILNTYPKAKILFLTTFLDDEYIIQALRLGARGYLMKSNVESILPSLYAIEKGQHVYGDEIIEKIPGFILNPLENKIKSNSHISLNSLTQNEIKIVELVAEGLNNKEISKELHFSEGTIRNYLSQILVKLNLRDRTQLAVHYYKNL